MSSTRHGIGVASSPQGPEVPRNSSPGQIDVELQPSPLPSSNGPNLYMEPDHDEDPPARFDAEEQGGGSPEVYRERTSTYEVLDQVSTPPRYGHSTLSRDHSFSASVIRLQHFSIPQLRYLVEAPRQGPPTLERTMFQS